VMSVESAETKPVVGTDIALVENAIDQRAALYYGERFLSLKKLLNRHFPAYIWSKTGQTAENAIETSIFINPLPFPAQIIAHPALPAGSDNALTPASYLSGAFLAMRGGMRYKFMRSSQRTQGTPGGSLASISPEITTVSTTFAYSGTSFTTVNQRMDPAVGGLGSIDFLKNYGLGAAVTQTTIHPFLEFEVPYTARTRFINPRKCLPWFTIPQNTECINYTWFPRVSPITENVDTFQAFQAVADDFSLHGFMYVPTFYSRATGT